MNNFLRKNKENSTYKNINYVDIIRHNLKKNDENNILNEPYLWKNKIELRRNLEYIEKEKRTFKKDTKKNNYKDSELKENCNKCFLKRIEREAVTKKVSIKLDIFNKSIIFDIASNLWDILNVEGENSIDLFNDKIYSDLTEKGKKKIQNYILPHFISYSENISEIQNVFFEKNINLKNKTDKNINELKRIANENNLCLLINYDKENKLSGERHMLITSKKAFFKIIREIIINENLLNSNNDNIILKSILQILENKERILNKEEKFLFRASNLDNSNIYLRKLNNLNKVNYRVKRSFPEKKKNNPLLKEDYEIIRKENVINDIIHNSIMQLSKNPRIKDIIDDKENNTSLLKYKNTTKKNRQYSKKNKKKEVCDPLHILKVFLKKDYNILDYKDFLDELRSCTFQPNIHKYIEEEKNNIKLKKFERKEKDNEEGEEEENEEEIKMMLKNDNTISSQLAKYICKATNDPYNIKNISIMKYLKLFDSYYNNMDKNSISKTKYYDDPTHRTSRKNFRSVNSCNLNIIKTRGKKKTENISCKNAWVNGLRGGYIKSYFDFSLNDKSEKEYELKKEHKIKQIDWGEKIRLNGRRLKTKVIPNLDLVDKIIKNNKAYTEEPPTIIVKKKFSECKCKNEKNKQSLMHKKNQNNNDCLKETVFNLQTSIETYKLNRSLRIKNELDNLGKLTSFAPPKVIAVKSDNTLEDIKRELLSLPESVHFISKFNFLQKKN
ncbi:conserved Plasmodium protein, unknown function [Plasmodium relictum]|uniref:Uncharacterized protein n=1 Tax=Plasmodium relictum TaxID=85471 RepID=A0A1J1H920_PLARL|nr:conserved Plasmodium protein, unknown function [Plasmodium relictum]CRH01465.1 conserved Plasmodium protein, unknown function [Plasmodium relictum]